MAYTRAMFSVSGCVMTEIRRSLTYLGRALGSYALLALCLITLGSGCQGSGGGALDAATLLLTFEETGAVQFDRVAITRTADRLEFHSPSIAARLPLYLTLGFLVTVILGAVRWVKVVRKAWKYWVAWLLLVPVALAVLWFVPRYWTGSTTVIDGATQEVIFREEAIVLASETRVGLAGCAVLLRSAQDEVGSGFRFLFRLRTPGGEYPLFDVLGAAVDEATYVRFRDVLAAELDLSVDPEVRGLFEQSESIWFSEPGPRD